MIRIAIVEDDKEVQAQLADYIRRYERQFGRMFELSLFDDGDEIVSDYRAVYDIILLDVQMRRMDGMAAAERIRQMDKDVLLIFITNMAQFAIRGYAVDALDYVLKPVPYFAFSQQLQKAVARLRARQKTFLTVPVEGGLRLVDVASLYYLESEGHKVRLYGEEGELTVSGTLKSFEEKLAGKPFARCNSGYLVNLAQVMGGSRTPCRWGRMNCRSAAPKRKPSWKHSPTISEVGANDAAGYSPPVHGFGGMAGLPSVCAGFAATLRQGGHRPSQRRVAAGDGGIFAAHRPCAPGMVDPLYGCGGGGHVPDAPFGV